MAGSPSEPASALEGSGRGSKFRRSMPAWAVVVIVAVSVTAAAGAGWEIGQFYVAHTTVTVDLISWALPPVNGTFLGYAISCQSFSSPACPTQVHPGSTYSGTIDLTGFPGNATLVVPSPFTLVSTDPRLPVTMPPAPGGVSLTFELRLPSSPGTYSFTGEILTS